MLRITIVLALAVLGNVEATVYEDVETIDVVADNSSNKYFSIRQEPSDNGAILYLVIEQDISPKLGIQLCETWKYDERGYGGVICGRGGGGDGSPLPPHGGIIRGPVCRELCCALDDLADRNPAFPRPDESLGLRNHRCPLKKGSYRIPDLSMPKTLDVDVPLLSDYTDYSSNLSPSKGCTSKTQDPYVFVDVVFVACETKN